MSRNRALRTSKNAVMLLAGTMVRMLASFAFVIYLANTLGVESFGQFAIANHYFDLFLSLTSTAVGILLTRDVSRWPQRFGQLLASAMAITTFLCIWVPPLLWGLCLALNYSELTIHACLISCLAIVPAAIAAVFEAAFVAKERAEFVTVGTIVECLVRIGASTWVLWIGGGIVELIWVLVLSRLVQAVMYWMLLRRVAQFKFAFQFAPTRRMAIRWRVFAAENWMATLYQSLDVILLSWIGGEVATGLYSASWKFVRLGAVIAKSFTTAVYPVMTQMYAKSRESFDRLFQQTVRAMCLLALPAIAGVSVLAERIVDLLYGAEFQDAVPVVRILVWILLVEFLNPFLSHALFAQGRQARSAFVAGISLVFNATATFLLVHKYGAAGAALATVLSGFVATIFYSAFSMTWDVRVRVMRIVAQVTVASLGMAIVLYFNRFAEWFWLIPFALASYVLMLFVVQALRISDIQYFRHLFLSRATA